MKANKIIMYMLLVGILIFPSIAKAQAVNWSSITYEAEVVLGSGINDVQISSTAPVSASASELADFGTYFTGASGAAIVTDNSFDIYAFAGDRDEGIYPETSVAAGLWGVFNSGNNSDFVIDYSYVYDIALLSTGLSGPANQSIYADNAGTLSIVVNDLTDSVQLSSISLLTDGLSGADTLAISTASNHDIEVQIVATSYIFAMHPGTAYRNSEADYLVNYSVSVAPEPVSTTLFILGGVFLVGRGYMRKKQINV